MMFYVKLRLPIYLWPKWIDSDIIQILLSQTLFEKYDFFFVDLFKTLIELLKKNWMQNRFFDVIVYVIIFWEKFIVYDDWSHFYYGNFIVCSSPVKHKFNSLTSLIRGSQMDRIGCFVCLIEYFCNTRLT